MCKYKQQVFISYLYDNLFILMKIFLSYCRSFLSEQQFLLFNINRTEPSDSQLSCQNS